MITEKDNLLIIVHSKLYNNTAHSKLNNNTVHSKLYSNIVQNNLIIIKSTYINRYNKLKNILYFINIIKYIKYIVSMFVSDKFLKNIIDINLDRPRKISTKETLEFQTYVKCIREKLD